MAGLLAFCLQEDLGQGVPPRSAAPSAPASANPCLHWRPSDMQGRSGSISCGGHCSFPLGPGTHSVFLVLFKSSVSPKSLPNAKVGMSDVGPRTFAAVKELLCVIILQSVACPPGGSMAGLMVTSSRRT